MGLADLNGNERLGVGDGVALGAVLFGRSHPVSAVVPISPAGYIVIS